MLLLGQTCKLWKAAIATEWADLVHCRWANIVKHLPSSILATARKEEHGYPDFCKRLSLKIEHEDYSAGKVKDRLAYRLLT